MFQFAFVSTAVEFRFRMELLSRLPLMTFAALTCFLGIWHLLQMAGTVCPPPLPLPGNTYTPKMASFPHLTRFTNQRKFLKNVSAHPTKKIQN